MPTYIPNMLSMRGTSTKKSQQANLSNAYNYIHQTAFKPMPMLDNLTAKKLM